MRDRDSRESPAYWDKLFLRYNAVINHNLKITLKSLCHCFVAGVASFRR